MTAFRMHLSGPLRLEGPDGRPVEGLSRRGQAMLAFLALQPGQRAERGKLADLLWSDRGEEQARASLRQELSVLGRRLPGILVADRQSVRLAEGALETDRTGPGAFLEGFDLRSEAWEDWLREKRSAMEEMPEATTTRGGRPAIAVLPFGEMGATGGDFFADGVVEEVTSALSRARDFDVIARQSAYALGGDAVDHRAAADRLGVDYLVEGSVRRSGDRVRITVHLIAGEDGRTLWSERFDDRLDDLFDLQDRIAAKVAGQLQPNIRTAEIARAGSKPPADLNAYELLLSAYPHFWSHRREGNRKARAFYDAALECDPDYAHARAMKAWCHAQEAAYVWADDPACERALALENVEHAAERTGDHAPTLVAICAALSLTTDDHARARAFIDRALAIDANSAWGWLRSAWLHCLFNEPVLALEQFARAERLSPLDPFLFNVQFGRAAANAALGDLDEAIRLVQTGMNMAPGVSWSYRMLAAYHGMKGDIAAAREAVAAYQRHAPGITLKRLRASMPPSIHLTNMAYFDGLRRAGLPEE